MQEKSKIFLFCHFNLLIRLFFVHFGDEALEGGTAATETTDQSRTAGSPPSAGHCSHEYIRTS